MTNRNWTKEFAAGFIMALVAILPAYYFWAIRSMFDIGIYLDLVWGIFSLVWFCLWIYRGPIWSRKVTQKLVNYTE